MRKIASFFGEKTDTFIQLNSQASEYAKSRGLEYIWAPQSPFNKENVVSVLKECDAGIIDVEPYGEEIFSQINDSTKILVRFGVGYDKVDLKAASANHIAVARTTGANTLGVAEMAMTFILASRRKLKLNDACVKSGNWVKYVVPETLESTIGIVGFGSIGRALNRLLKGLDCNVIAYDPFCTAEDMLKAGVRKVELDELFSTANAISLHLPYGKETHHLVGEHLLGLMRPDAVIVNTSRGNIIDEEALYNVLKDNKIGGAALDVFGVEPLPVSSKLIELDNIILTPHVSSQTIESLWRIYKMAIDIAADFFEGNESPHILNPDYKG